MDGARQLAGELVDTSEAALRGFGPRAAAAARPRALRRQPEEIEAMTRCPECESDLELDGYELDVGETINCPECSVELKVVAADPVGGGAGRARAVGRQRLAEAADRFLLVLVDLEERQQARDESVVRTRSLAFSTFSSAPEVARGLAARPPARPGRRCPGRTPRTG